MNQFLRTVLQHCEAEPGAVFAWVRQGGAEHTLTRAKLRDHALRCARWLIDSGLSPGQIVFIIAPHQPALYPVYLGVMLAGGVPSFLPHPTAKQDADLYWQTHRQVFQRSHAAWVLADKALLPALEAACLGLATRVADIGYAHAPAADPTIAVRRADHDIALLQHSSGTTGLKKGVALSYAAIQLQLDHYAAALGLDHAPSCRIASWLPLYHDMGLIACFMLPLYRGIALVALDPFEWTAKPVLLLDAIQAHRASHVWLPNFAFNHLVRSVPRSLTPDLSSIRAFVSCSEPCKADSFDRFAQRFGVPLAALQTCYAMAETVFAVTQSDPSRAVPRLCVDRDALEHQRQVAPVNAIGPGAVTLLSCGTPIAGIELRIRHASDADSDQTVGEIQLRAPFLFAAYFADASGTALAFDDGWYRTGDLGFVHNGELYVCGRIKDLLIINGRNYFAHDVEAAVNEVPGIKPGRCVALGYDDDRSGSEQLVIVAERDTDATQDMQIVQAINASLNRHLGIPASDIRLVDAGWLIKTTSGKISRKDNRAKYALAFRQAPHLTITSSGEPR